MKYALIFFVSLIAFSTATHAQKVKKSKKSILVDGQECFTIERELAANLIILKNQEGEEVMRIRHKTRATLTGDDQYQVISFVKSGESFSTTSYIYTSKMLVKRLIENGVINQCMMDESKIPEFVTKYDEKVE